MKKNISGRTCVGVVIVAGVMLLASCLPVPLGDPETSKVDAKLTGVWLQTKDNGERKLIAIAPADSHVYIIENVDYIKDGDALKVIGRGTMRAWLTDVQGTRFLVCEFMEGMCDPKKAEKVYPTFKISATADKVELSLIDEKYAAFKSVKDPAALAKAIGEHLNDAAMYNNQALTFQRLDQEDAKNKALVDLVHGAGS